ncbi:hypothetical protein H0274_05475 [Altererythrobacter sp. CC-YST694]|uniref:hypothetical protein n=1 Tax=Altererythrobacter sp. CC-YST694 TaxID=2755038 RepID=UPI001D009BA5|nr:hypothetical protein [Altererythrobacter sp. CC-YST694]MCB5424700.1 hypothetical protein [Altererythrobacter sp. CC-YST694]
MTSLPSRDLKIGIIIDKTMDVVGRNIAPALLYIAVIAGLGVAAGLVRGDPQQAVSFSAMIQASALGLAATVVGIIGSYLLIEAMLRRTGLVTQERDRRFFAYLGMSLLIGLAVGAGLIFLIIPGLVLMARWSVAPSLFIGRGMGIMDSLGKSWEATKGNEFTIIAASLAMMILFYALAFLPPFLFPQLGLVGTVIGQLGSAAASVISCALGVALFGLISARDTMGVFD